MQSKSVTYEGRVQGVGFRYSTKQIATGFDVAGSVRNLPDGGVELVVTGDPEEVDAFLQEIEDSHLGGLIRKSRVEDIPLVEGARGFTISY